MLVFQGTNRLHDAVAFSPDGRELAAAGSDPGDYPHRPGGTGVEVWNLAAGPAEPRRLFPDRGVTRLRYDPAGRWLFAYPVQEASADLPPLGVGAADRAEPGPAAWVGSGDLNDVLEDVRAGRLLASGRHRVRGEWAGWLACQTVTGRPPFPAVWRVELGGWGYVSSAALLPDGRAASVEREYRERGAAEYTLSVRAADTGAVVVTVAMPGRSPGPLTVSPDGELVVMNAGQSLHVWRTADIAAPARKVVFGRKHCTGVAFHPSGAYLLAAGNDGTVRRLDTTTGKELASYAWRAGKARRVAVSPDGLLAAAGTNRGKVVVWDLDD